MILHNDEVAVVDFDGKKIQIPNSKLIGKTAFIKYEKGKYTTISKDEFDKYISNKSKECKKRETANKLKDIEIDMGKGSSTSTKK